MTTVKYLIAGESIIQIEDMPELARNFGWDDVIVKFVRQGEVLPLMFEYCFLVDSSRLIKMKVDSYKINEQENTITFQINSAGYYAL